MFLCLDLSKIKSAGHIQKNINLQQVVDNCTILCSTLEEARDRKCLPLDIAVTIRSCRTNLVLRFPKIEGKDYYYYFGYATEMIPPPIHKGYDLIMYLTSRVLVDIVNKYDEGFDVFMSKNSAFLPIGFFYDGRKIYNPTLVTQIIINDEGAKDFEKYLKEGAKFVTIDDMEKDHILLPEIVKGSIKKISAVDDLREVANENEQG